MFERGHKAITIILGLTTMITITIIFNNKITYFSKHKSKTELELQQSNKTKTATLRNAQLLCCRGPCLCKWVWASLLVPSRMRIDISEFATMMFTSSSILYIILFRASSLQHDLFDTIKWWFSLTKIQDLSRSKCILHQLVNFFRTSSLLHISLSSLSLNLFLCLPVTNYSSYWEVCSLFIYS